jgi:putative copper export protein
MQAGSLAGSLGGMTVADLEAVVAHTRWGAGWVAQAIGVVLLFVAVRGGRGALAVRTGRWPLVALAGVIMAIGASAMGHPAAVDEAPVVAMGLDAIHAVAAGTWAGGLAGLAIVALPLLMTLPVEHRTSAVRSALRAFSTIALIAASALVITGLVGGWLQLHGDVSALVATTYGRILLAKLAVVAVVAGLGAYHWRVAQPALASDQSLVRLRTSARTELLLMVLVLVLTAILTGTSPVEAAS